MKYVYYCRPSLSGLATYANLFTGLPVKIDPGVRQFLGNGDEGRFEDVDRYYSLFEVEKGSKSDTHVIDFFSIKEFTTRDEAWANLVYLSKTSEMLAIPEGEDEVNFIIGYINNGGKQYVLFVEHEIEDGVEEIHIHCRLHDQWKEDGNDPLKGFAKVPETD